MQFTGELTLGAVGIIASILGSAISGIVALLVVYMKTRTDITALQLGHADLKTDMAEIKGDLKAMSAQMQAQHVMLERVSARQEITATISNLPSDIASAVGKLITRDRA